MLKYRNNVTTIDVDDWNELVTKTYGKPYNYQQQEGCLDRGTTDINIPSSDAEWHEQEMNDMIPQVINGDDMGVKFPVWLERDINAPLVDEEDGTEQSLITLFWYRNFYPSIHTLANDLHAKGLVPSGKYQIVIDW